MPIDLADERAIIAIGEIGLDFPCGLTEKTGILEMRRQQCLHFPEQVGIARGCCLQVRAAADGVVFERGVKDIVDLLPALLVHACEFPSSSRASQAEATVQCRLTVAGEISIASAVSSTVSPPKKRSSTRRA